MAAARLVPLTFGGAQLAGARPDGAAGGVQLGRLCRERSLDLGPHARRFGAQLRARLGEFGAQPVQLRLLALSFALVGPARHGVGDQPPPAVRADQVGDDRGVDRVRGCRGRAVAQRLDEVRGGVGDDLGDLCAERRVAVECGGEDRRAHA